MNRTKILLLFFSVTTLFNKSFSQWSSNSTINTPLSIASSIQKDISISSDKKNGAILIWEDLRNGITEDVYAQRINSAGFIKWAVNGIPVCTAVNKQNSATSVEDGNGGVIVAWDDFRSNSSDIYAQKIDSNGVIQWALNGVAVCSKALSQESSKIISDGAGGAIIAWEDSTSAGIDIYAQRISSTGNILWAGNGVPICSSPLKQSRPRLQPDNAGGAFIVWQDKRNGIDYDIYAQRINSSGNVMWATNGILICNAVNTQSHPKLRGDGANGVIIAWQDKRNALDFDLYAQRIGAGGNIKWQTNGVVVCAEADNQEELDITNENNLNGVILCWTDHRSLISNNSDIYIQRIDTSGNQVWASNGIALTSSFLDQKNSNLVGDGAGGAIVVWQDSVAGNQWDVKAQRVTINGQQQWGLNGLSVCNNTSSQTQPVNISSGVGASIFAWEDKRNTIDDIYVQRFPTTITGIETQFANHSDFAIYPNPFNTTAHLYFKGIESFDYKKAEIKFTSVTGQSVEFLTEINEDGITLHKNNLPAGIYFYVIIFEGNTYSGKIVIGQD